MTIKSLSHKKERQRHNHKSQDEIHSSLGSRLLRTFCFTSRIETRLQVLFSRFRFCLEGETDADFCLLEEDKRRGFRSCYSTTYSVFVACHERRTRTELSVSKTEKTVQVLSYSPVFPLDEGKRINSISFLVSPSSHSFSRLSFFPSSSSSSVNCFLFERRWILLKT